MHSRNHQREKEIPLPTSISLNKPCYMRKALRPDSEKVVSDEDLLTCKESDGAKIWGISSILFFIVNLAWFTTHKQDFIFPLQGHLHHCANQQKNKTVSGPPKSDLFQFNLLIPSSNLFHCIHIAPHFKITL